MQSVGLVRGAGAGADPRRRTRAWPAAVLVAALATIPRVALSGATITVDSPNGGEVWNIGSPDIITWTTSGTDVRIQLSRDGRSTWANIIASTPAAPASYTWDPVTGPASDNCYVRVWNLTDGKNDRSNSGFTVAPGLFDLLSPADMATDVSLAVTFDWGDSAGADTYTLLVDDDPAFASPEVNDATLTSSTYTVGAGALTPGVTYYWQVTSVASTSAVSGTPSTPASNNDFSFTTTTALPPPGPFALVSPAHMSTGVSVTPTLDWEDSGWAATYALVVDDDPTFAVPAGYEVDEAALVASTYTVGAGVLLPDVTYYWRVTAVNASGSTDASNNDFSFATPPLPGAFNLLSPADASTGVLITPTLDWEDSSDATTYTLLVDDDPAFGGPEVNDATLVVSTYTVGAGLLLPGVTYHWRVTAVNGSGGTPASTGDFSFTTLPVPGAFSLVSPADAATGVSLTPTLDWGDSTDAVTYTLVVDDDPLFAVPADYEVNEAALAASTYTVGAGVLLPDVTYYWRVTAVNASGSTPASNNDFSFATPPLPGAFNLLSPADASTGVLITPTLDWEDSSDAATYTLLLDDDPAFGSPEVDDATLTESTYAVGAGALLPDTAYHWRVTAVNGSGSAAASNNDFTFTTSPAPGTFNLLAPADASTGLSLTPTLDWEDSADVVTYTLLVDDDPAFASPDVTDATLTESTYAVGAALLPGVTYFWRVTAVNASGGTDASNNDFSFTTLPVPGAFDLLSPADAATGVSLTPTLNWGDSSDAASYALEVADNESFIAPVVVHGALTASTYTVGAGVLSTGVTYYWRVTAANDSGTTPASNNDFSFGTVPLPGAFRLVGPSAGATDVSVTPILDWEDSPDAETYTLLLDDDPFFGDPEVSGATLTESTYTVAAGLLLPGVKYYWRVTAANSFGSTPASNNDFSFTTAVPVSLTVTAPGSDEILDIGVPFDVTWTSHGVENVKIELSRDGGASREDVVASTGAAAGRYAWNVTGPGSDNCVLWISDAADGVPSGSSEGAFTIAEITLTSPTGGEVWFLNYLRNITWQAVGVSVVRIEISRDGGGSWEEIAASTDAAVGLYAWRVAGCESAACLIRVSDAADGVPAATSPAVFSISLPEEAVAEPYLGDGCVGAPRADRHCSVVTTGAWLVCLAWLIAARGRSRRHRKPAGVA